MEFSLLPVIELAIIIAALSSFSNASSNSKFVCQSKTETLSCPVGLQIQVRSVNYGRTNENVCTQNLNINCYSSGRVTGVIATACNHQQSCTVTADNTVLGEDPCPNTPKYLDLQWDCNPIPTTTTTTITTTTTPPPTTRQTQPPSVTSPNQPSAPEVCHEYLISGKNKIPDNKLTASSTFTNFSSGEYGPERARLFTPTEANTTYKNGGWSPQVSDRNQYIQAEFSSPSMIRGIVTQGRNIGYGETSDYNRVTKYTVQFSVDGVTFDSVKDGNGNDVVFTGNVNDQEKEVTNMFGCPVIAKYIRIKPVNWANFIGLRFDALGCPTKTDPYGVCPKGWEERPGSDECYLITYNQAKDYEDARRACLLEQGDLLVLDDIQERSWIEQKVLQYKAKYSPTVMYQLWMGLSNAPRKDTQNYKWLNGKPLDNNVLPWKKGMPDNYAGQEHCGELVDGGLNDVACMSPINYICEKSKYWNHPGAATTQVPPVRVTNSPISPFNNPPNNGGGSGSGGSGGSSGSGGNLGGGGGSGNNGGNGGSNQNIGNLSGQTTKNSANQNNPFRTTQNFGPVTQPSSTKPIGGKAGAVVIGSSTYFDGCWRTTDCYSVGRGYRQSCRGCSSYLACSYNGGYVFQCPPGLYFDNNQRACVGGRSSTCSGP